MLGPNGRPPRTHPTLVEGGLLPIWSDRPSIGFVSEQDVVDTISECGLVASCPRLSVGFVLVEAKEGLKRFRTHHHDVTVSCAHWPLAWRNAVAVA